MSKEGQSTPVMDEQLQAEAQQQSHARHHLLWRLAPYVAAGVAAAGAVELVNFSNSGSHSVATAAGGNVPNLVNSPNQALANCENLHFGQSAANASNYNSDAFFPNTTVATPEDAKQYVLNLFSKDGPLAGDTQMESLGAAMSTVVEAAHQGGFENTNYDYIDHFNKALGRYKGNGGRDRAVSDCKEAFNTLIQDVGYNDNWANSGETVTEFAAVRDKQSNDVAATTMFRGIVKQGVTLKGVEFKLRTTSKGENGYLSVLISTNSEGVENGTIFIKGLTVQQFNGKSQTNHGKNPAKKQHELHQANTGSQVASGLGGVIVRRSSNGQLTLSSAGGGSGVGAGTGTGHVKGGGGALRGRGGQGVKGGSGGGTGSGSTEGSHGSTSGSGGQGTGGSGSAGGGGNAGGGSGNNEGNNGSGAGSNGNGGGSGGGETTPNTGTTPPPETNTTPPPETNTTPPPETNTTPSPPTTTGSKGSPQPVPCNAANPQPGC